MTYRIWTPAVPPSAGSESGPTPTALACRTVQLTGGDREDGTPLVTDLACPSCGAPGTGHYCAQCGERFPRARDFELGHFLSEHVAHEMLEFDGKLPRTLRVLLTQPGQLALEYVSGRRKPFVSPLRLYLVTFLLHLFLLSFLAPHPLTMPELSRMFDPSGFLARLMASRASIDWSGSQPHEHFLERVHWISQALTLLVFLGVAGIQSLLLIRLRRHYLEHLSLALNVSAFYLLLCVAGDVVAALFWHQEMQQAAYQIASVLALTALPLYWCFSARRFYRIGWPAAIAVAVLLTISTALLANVLQVGMLAVIIETT
jgi:hypothetical protein